MACVEVTVMLLLRSVSTALMEKAGTDTLTNLLTVAQQYVWSPGPGGIARNSLCCGFVASRLRSNGHCKGFRLTAHMEHRLLLRHGTAQ